MKWLEVIKLRSSGKNAPSLDELFLSMPKMAQTGLAEIKVYRHAALDADVGVHLHWDSDRPEQNGSTLGIRLGQALKEFGLVDHSVWTEYKK